MANGASRLQTLAGNLHTSAGAMDQPMSTDHIRYDLLARDALRGVLRRVLTDAAEQGLPGEHHFFITFMSKADGVKISPRLLAQHPEEMTIILQHQFWDLTVSEERFEVGLSFGGIPERLVVPFNSIKSFYDPSVQFGLQFEPAETETAAADMPPGAPSPAVPSPAVLAVPDTPSPPAAAETEDKPKPSEGAEVVRLDRFRKK
ncbi:protein of unknown function DUF1321 [Nitrobacter hamburgensis X14]|uniref:Stringent starvation protein B n=2 Tax=Nitrobacter hamburgensis TaxID=912 RepID=Q1QJT7_NITHX|nr:protein of unknown function DUF1321 [Nitrobacter hamburgensis X14]